MIDSGFILKVQRPHRRRPRTSLEKEVLFLNELNKGGTHISVPEVLGYGRESTAADDIEYILMTRLKGFPFRHLHPQPQGEVRKTALHALGWTLRQIHQLPQEELGRSNLFAGDQNFDTFKSRLDELFTETATAVTARMSSNSSKKNNKKKD